MLLAVIMYLLFCLEPISLLSTIIFARASTLWDPVIVWASTLSVDSNGTVRDTRGEETQYIVPTSKDKKCKHFYVVGKVGRVYKNTLYIVWLTNRPTMKIWFWSIILRLTRQKCFSKRSRLGLCWPINHTWWETIDDYHWCVESLFAFVWIIYCIISFVCFIQFDGWTRNCALCMTLSSWACQWL